jgi:hypothetical protein
LIRSWLRSTIGEVDEIEVWNHVQERFNLTAEELESFAGIFGQAIDLDPG